VPVRGQDRGRSATAADAGGVAVAGQLQNSLRVSWSHAEVDRRLHNIIGDIHQQCVEWGDPRGRVNDARGANLSGSKGVPDAMLAYGIV
jgi:glutamate dehydrogenase (NADP+)